MCWQGRTCVNFDISTEAIAGQRDERGAGQNLLLCSVATRRRKSLWLELSPALELTSCHSREPRLLATCQGFNHTTITLHQSQQSRDPRGWPFVCSPRCWDPPTPRFFCRGECLQRGFPPRHYLCSCSRPHSCQTPETRQAQKSIKIASFHPFSDKTQRWWRELPSSFQTCLNLIFHRGSFPEFLSASLASVGRTEWNPGDQNHNTMCFFLFLM